MQEICYFPRPSPAEEAWIEQNAEALKKHIISHHHPRWGRLICTWVQKKETGEVLRHQYAFCLDKQNSTLFIDCSPLKIYLKCMAQLLLRPAHILIKTISHLFLIHVMANAIQTLLKKQSLEAFMQHTARSICDIVRTPLFGAALIVTSIAVLCIGLFNHESMYTGRDLIGKIEQFSNWGTKHTWDTLAPCFQPFPLSIIENFKYRTFSDTIYSDEDPIGRQLSNLARTRLMFMQNHCEAFELGKLNLNKSYTSPILIQ